MSGEHLDCTGFFFFPCSLDSGFCMRSSQLFPSLLLLPLGAITASVGEEAPDGSYRVFAGSSFSGSFVVVACVKHRNPLMIICLVGSFHLKV